MTIQTLTDLLKAKPFQPFILKCRDGELIEVPHPEKVYRDADTTLMIIGRGNGRYTIVDLSEIVRADFYTNGLPVT